MAFMKSDDILPTGIPAIDNQHQLLVSVVNEMHDQILNCKTLEEERLLTGKFLEDLQEYAQIHFATEEEILLNNNYSELARHQAEHRLFINEIQRIRGSHSKGELALSFDVFLFARAWIANHINVSDQEYIQFITS
jgi:hemerythrin